MKYSHLVKQNSGDYRRLYNTDSKRFHFTQMSIPDLSRNPIRHHCNVRKHGRVKIRLRLYKTATWRDTVKHVHISLSLSAVICQWLNKMSEQSTWRAPGRWRGVSAGTQSSWQHGSSGGLHKTPKGNWTEAQKNLHIRTKVATMRCIYVEEESTVKGLNTAELILNVFFSILDYQTKRVGETKAGKVWPAVVGLLTAQKSSLFENFRKENIHFTESTVDFEHAMEAEHDAGTIGNF